MTLWVSAPSKKQLVFFVVILGGVVTSAGYFVAIKYYSGVEYSDSTMSCVAQEVIRACSSSSPLRVLFFVLSDSEDQRKLIRSTYAKPSFAHPIHWRTVFVTHGPSLSSLSQECGLHGDMLVSIGNTIPKFVTWAKKVCSNASLVVYMDQKVLPHPFYLAHYKRTRIQAKAQNFFCVPSWTNGTMSCSPLVIAFHGAMLENAEALENEDPEKPVHLARIEDMRSFVAVNESMHMLYTVGAVVFFEHHERVELNWTTLWEATMMAEENDPLDLYL
ncbi:uncharacterized protein LOC135399611 [Ornithodoros turicata]|uniref:uncharacterized protein LOC135399611 n=1 Tax=Ornithodoros turicata TaxID=34597 RepID=UPI0031397B13